MSRPLLAAAMLLALASPAFAQAVPTKVGQCVKTRITDLATRLDGVPDSGAVVGYAGDIYGISYDKVPELAGSKIGDPVKLCLVSIPEDCPAGDDRGKYYSAYNPRTGKTWSLPDAEHMCGGA